MNRQSLCKAGLLLFLLLPILVQVHNSNPMNPDFAIFAKSGLSSIDRLIFSTFLGGSDSDIANSIAVDEENSIYVCGSTASLDFPSANANDSLFSSGVTRIGDGGHSDCFVVKFNAAGDKLLYATLIGGSRGDSASDIWVDSSGSAYVVGRTSSTDFPVINAYDDSFNGGNESPSFWNSDCFAFKLNATGNGLLYSTYLGGSADEWAASVAVDSSGNAYIAGTTFSSDFPTLNAYDDTFNGGVMDCFVAKLSAEGKSLVYSTYVGSSDMDEAESIAVDSLSNVYVTGSTRSIDFPIVNAYDDAFSINGTKSTSYEWDCFVFKMDASGNSFVFSSYIGGSDSDTAFEIQLDYSNNVYITGHTDSTDFPSTQMFNTSTDTGWGDCFVIELNHTGQTLVHSAIIGGSHWDYGMTIKVDFRGNVFVAGRTRSSDFPTVSAYDQSHNGGYDCFVLELNGTDWSLLGSTFIGGNGPDQAHQIDIDTIGDIYVTGFTESVNFPVLNAYDSEFDGGPESYEGDSFVLKMSTMSEPTSTNSPDVTNADSSNLILSLVVLTLAIIGVGALVAIFQYRGYSK